MNALNDKLNFILVLALGILMASVLFTVYTPEVDASIARQIVLPFHYSFTTNGALEEDGFSDNSNSFYWWVTSGAYLYLNNGIGMTIQGALPEGSKWRTAFNLVAPGETDDGAHPQNLFRLLSRSIWKDIRIENYFKVNRSNLSSDPHRTGSNGLLFMTRYLDENNLYYAGLRVDGYAVIKKKKQGIYYTLAYAPVVTGTGRYDRASNPNLLPVGTWIGLRQTVRNVSAGMVEIKLYADIGKTGQWSLVASATDDGATYGGSALTAPGFTGIRTDFMDVEFEDFWLTDPSLAP